MSPLNPRMMQTINILDSLCSCTGLVVSYLVANDEARFSRDKVYALVKLEIAKYAHSSSYSVPLQ